MSSGQLQYRDGDDTERCAICRGRAAGPCASCKRSVCGDCCTLTEGGAKTWAICLSCDRNKGRSLRSPWIGFGLYFGGILALLATVVILLHWLAG